MCHLIINTVSITTFDHILPSPASETPIRASSCICSVTLQPSTIALSWSRGTWNLVVAVNNYWYTGARNILTLQSVIHVHVITLPPFKQWHATSFAILSLTILQCDHATIQCLTVWWFDPWQIYILSIWPLTDLHFVHMTCGILVCLFDPWHI